MILQKKRLAIGMHPERLEEMTDKEIIEGLIERNPQITEQFFFHKCKPLFLSIMRFVFSYEVDYDEFVNELYQYLMEGDAYKLRQFQYRSTVCQWLKTLTLRYFIKRRDELIENESKEPLYEEKDDAELDESESRIAARIDLDRLLAQMANQRYAWVIRKLMIEEETPETVAKNMGVTTANLYNIKKRAMAALTQVAIKDINHYGKKN